MWIQGTSAMNFVSIPQLEKENRLSKSAEYLRRLCAETIEAETHVKTKLPKYSVRKEPVSEGADKYKYLVDIDVPEVKKYLVSEQSFVDAEYISEQNITVPKPNANIDSLVSQLDKMNLRCIDLALQAGQTKLLEDSESRTKEEYFRIKFENENSFANSRHKQPALDPYCFM